jgi:hypothetical protein
MGAINSSNDPWKHRILQLNMNHEEVDTFGIIQIQVAPDKSFIMIKIGIFFINLEQETEGKFEIWFDYIDEI